MNIIKNYRSYKELNELKNVTELGLWEDFQVVTRGVY
jgi:hypothetical protein